MECAFGEIDLRWGFFWKILNFSLENTAILIEGAMRLHTYLVDDRERNNGIHHLASERELFQQDVSNSGSIPVQTGNDLGRPQGNITNDEGMNRLKGMLIRDGLRQSLADHDMRPKMKHWHCDPSSHTYSETNN